MKLIKVTEVTYEALGRVTVTYTDSTDLEYIRSVVQLIIPTAHVELKHLRQTQVTASEYKDNNLSHIEAWYKKIQSDYPENYDPFNPLEVT